MSEKTYTLPLPEAFEFLEMEIKELEERVHYRFLDIEKRLDGLESNECSVEFKGPENGLCAMRNGKLVTLDKDSLEKELVSALDTIMVLQKRLLSMR
ncbi:MAG: hypothetical protein GX874_14220 [Smithella sp.]|nr:hypothetical protein [Smithella sp.]